MVRVAALRSSALSLAKNFSRGFGSGEYGGREQSCARCGEGFFHSCHLVTAETGTEALGRKGAFALIQSTLEVLSVGLFDLPSCT